MRPHLAPLLVHLGLLSMIVGLGLPFLTLMSALVALLEPVRQQYEADRASRQLLIRAHRWGGAESVRTIDLSSCIAATVRHGSVPHAGQTYWVELRAADRVALNLAPAIDAPAHTRLLLEVVEFGMGNNRVRKAGK